MKTALKIAMAFLFIMLAGCSIRHDYVWDEYQIAPAKWTEEDNFVKDQQITLIEGEAATSEELLGSVGAHHYYANMQMLTHGIVEHLAIELEQKQAVINDSAGKTMEITVDGFEFERGMWKLAATINYTVRFGNGDSKTFTVRNSSPATVDRTYNGVIAMAVVQIIHDPDVRKYLMD